MTYFSPSPRLTPPMAENVSVVLKHINTVCLH